MGNMLLRQVTEFSMNDPDNKPDDDDQAKPLSGSNDKVEDTGTTMRLQTLKLEGELWPDGEPDDPSVEPIAETQIDPAEDDGVDPYNTGRFDTKKI